MTPFAPGQAEKGRKRTSHDTILLSFIFISQHHKMMQQYSSINRYFSGKLFLEILYPKSHQMPHVNYSISLKCVEDIYLTARSKFLWDKPLCYEIMHCKSNPFHPFKLTMVLFVGFHNQLFGYDRVVVTDLQLSLLYIFQERFLWI